MDTTPPSLLERLRKPSEQRAWEQFVQLYTPLLFAWARRLGLAEDDAADLVQDVFTLLVQKLPEFTYDRHQRFRGWLWTVTLNKWREKRRRRQASAIDGQADLAQIADADPVAAFDEADYRRYIMSRALQLMQSDFQPSTWKACWEHVVSGRPAAEVAAELGITTGAVYVAKCRVLRRLRQELEGLLY
jgi:RNA polymerase sigma-70 factor (ECF subfamily)